MNLITIAICLLDIAIPRSTTLNTVPLVVLRSRHIAVQAMINGEGPYRLVLDTGAPITFINRRLASKLGLLDPEAAKKKMVIGMAGQVKIRSLEVGGAKAEDVPVIMLDHPIVEMIGEVEGGIDGIIGYTFWSRFRMTLDYQAKRLSLEENGYAPHDVLSSVMGRLMRSDNRPLLISPGGIWGMEATAKNGQVFVKRVTTGWPAAIGGLLAGDRIKTINRRWTDSMPDLLNALATSSAGEAAELVVVRGKIEVKLIVQPRPGL